MIQGPLRRIQAAAVSNTDASGAISRVQTLSVLTLIVFAVMLWLMQDPWYAS
jgi:hypothetical protein